MFFELIGTIVAGVAAALLVWAINRPLKGRLPRWLMPVAAGAAMLLAAISSEYGWYDRTRERMPEGMVVAQTIEERSFYRPWTYAAPYVTRFVAVDVAAKRTHPDQPGQRIVDLVFYGRWARTAKIPMLFDCAEGRRADIADGVAFAPDGAVEGADWRAAPEGDPVFAAACAEV
ncbi:hypothetical protein JANAI62_09440 [Jannaschia pagri]|uniref:Uncharacterized protein n=1 Tax=Jannaschia pagri TaxID=2829797 RepID=A0ABQ4NJ29_9RHOB|nr:MULTISPECIES: hypothetical protein [unclassified Jannaschia]GIT89571.1 hypothetical protein JANAI61_00290 [Jannaschia sp. AI_61]GIT94321.1 hypothetical protein JANAI62_09440 [Jannaschia sp. AI_62]